jgi:hypothetical protein
MVKGLLNDRQELEALFDELAEELVELGKRVEIVMPRKQPMWLIHLVTDRS